MTGNRYPHIIQEYYVTRVREVMAARHARIEALKTREDAQRYVQEARRAVKRCFPSMPKRAALNARVVAREELPNFTLEKVIFESRPGFLVTGNLYLPANLTGKAPGVLGVCGHSPEGKAYDLYQSFCQGLALRGFVVFIIDPISQGERQQVKRKDQTSNWNCCVAHNAMGNPMVLVDDFFGTWRVWDAIRGLDYLLSRPEVDKSRVGVTGNSGGGTLSTYVTALDSRLTMAAPSCFVCSYLANLENELPADAEQNPPGILAAGLDEVDMLLCHAPRPTLLLSQKYDFFDPRAARQAGEDLKRVHNLLGAKGSAEYFEGPRAHGYFQENREAMYGFFTRHAGLTGSAKEKGVHPLLEQTLRVTPRGSILPAGNRPVCEFTAESAAELAKARGKPTSDQVTRAARKLLGISAVRTAPHYRKLRPPRYGEAPCISAQFAVESEPGVQVLVSVCGPVVSQNVPPVGPVTLYVGHRGGLDDLQHVRELKALTKGKAPLLLVDPRGMGETAPGTCGNIDFLDAYGSDYLYASTGEMLGESYLGRRVFDLLRAMDCLQANGVTRMELVGRGMGSVVVAFAALLHPSKPRVKIFDYLPSYELLTQSPTPTWPLSTMLRGVLKHFDLPDVYRALGSRLKKKNPWGARVGRG